MLIEISDEVLKQLSTYAYALDEDNESGCPFEFWHTEGLLSASEEIITAAQKAGWERPAAPKDDEDEDGDGPHDRPDCPCGHPPGTQGPCAGCNCADPE